MTKRPATQHLLRALLLTALSSTSFHAHAARDDEQRQERREKVSERREEGREKRQDRQEASQDRRQDKRDNQQERREDVRDNRQDLREDQRGNRQDRRDDRQDRRVENRPPIIVQHRHTTVVNKPTTVVDRRPRGSIVEHLPAPPRVVVHSGMSFYFSNGGWYRPSGPRFVVVAPPIGIFIPVLPNFYVTRVIRGSRYYVADDVYYRDAPGGYEVSAAPYQELDNDSDSKLFIYPRNGQSADQQDFDRYECHAWGMEQTGFDPTLPGGGVPSSQVSDKRNDYQRAMGACLDARGYTVR